MNLNIIFVTICVGFKQMKEGMGGGTFAIVER